MSQSFISHSIISYSQACKKMSDKELSEQIKSAPGFGRLQDSHHGHHLIHWCVLSDKPLSIIAICSSNSSKHLSYLGSIESYRASMSFFFLSVSQLTQISILRLLYDRINHRLWNNSHRVIHTVVESCPPILYNLTITRKIVLSFPAFFSDRCMT